MFTLGFVEHQSLTLVTKIFTNKDNSNNDDDDEILNLQY